jgi:nucleotide-binding universal stress UspA family protein
MIAIHRVRVPTDFSDAADAALAYARDVTAQFGSRVHVLHVLAAPVEHILEYICANEIDLVVMGTHGRGTVGHLLLGSLAERVVRRAGVPVLTVHGPPTVYHFFRGGGIEIRQGALNE